MNDESIFHEALARRTPAERAAYLDHACAGDPELRASVESLLQAHAGATSFLERPPPVGRPAEAPGLCIGPYQLLRLIGEGGMGAVWMAEQSQPVRRQVALKLIKPGMDSKQVVARFEQERQALALMEHAHIARVHDGGATADGRPYFVMELVQGVPITSFCDLRRLTVPQRLELFVLVCQAVQHAHQKGVIHRDLKPSNILVALYDGVAVPKVIDFGIAKATGPRLGGQSVYTEAGAVVGTLEYMSPEQAEPTQPDVDTRSDVYSLGVLLYELLTGTTPLERKRLKTTPIWDALRLIREEEPPKPSSRLDASPELPTIAEKRGLEPRELSGVVRGELDWVVMKCLEKDRSQRYDSAAGLALDLQHYLADEPVSACPPSALYRVRKFVRRHKGPVLAAALVLLALLGGIVGTTWGLLRATNEAQEKEKARAQAVIEAQEKETARAQAEARRLEAKTAQEKAEEAKRQSDQARRQSDESERRARRRFHAAQLNLAGRALQDNQPARVLDLLESLRPRPGDDDLRTFEWYYLWNEVHRGLLHVLACPRRTQLRTVAFSPDGSLVAAAGDAGVIYAWDVKTGALRFSLSSHSHIIYRIAFSPDGRYLAAAPHIFDPFVRVWDVATQARVAEFATQDHCRSIAFSPDGKTLAVGLERNEIRCWETAGWKPGPRIAVPGGIPWQIAFAPDGKHLAVARGYAGGANLMLFDLAASPPKPVGPLKSATGVAYAPDGRSLARVGGGVHVCDPASGAVKWSRPAEQVVEAAFSPDSAVLATAGGADHQVVWRDGATGKELARRAHRGMATTVAVSREGVWATAGSEGTVQLWKVPGSPAVDLVRAEKPIKGMALLPDGHNLLVGGEFWLKQIDVRTLRPTGSPPRAWGQPFLSPDGRRLATVPPPEEGRPAGLVSVWDMQTGRQTAEVSSGQAFTKPWFAFSPDNKTLLVQPRPQSPLWGWDLSGPRPQLQLKVGATGMYQGVGHVAFAPDSKTLAVAYQYAEIHLVDALRGTGRLQLEKHLGGLSFATQVAYSPDGQLVAGATTLGALRVWEAADGRLVATLKGHNAPVTALVFFPDGRTLASAAGPSVRLWDVPTGQERLTLPDHPAAVTALLVTPDGHTLISCCDDGLVRLFRTATRPEATARNRGEDADAPDSLPAVREHVRRLERAGRRADADRVRWSVPDEMLRHPPGDVSDDHVFRGELFVQRGRYAEAADAYGEALRLEPDNRNARTALATVRQVPRLQDEVRQRPTDAQAHASLGAALQRLGAYPEAEAAYREALKHHRANPTTWYYLGLVLRRLERPEDAAAAFQEVLRLQPDHTAALAQVTWHLAERSGPRSEILAACRKLIDRGYDNAGTCNNLAWRLATGPGYDRADGGHEVAVALARRAAELSPKSRYHWNTLGVAHYRAGQWPDALKALERSAALANEDRLAFDDFFIAMAHWRMGQMELARTAYERGEQWRLNYLPHDAELRQFSNEARALIGPSVPHAPAPAKPPQPPARR